MSRRNGVRNGAHRVLIALLMAPGAAGLAQPAFGGEPLVNPWAAETCAHVDVFTVVVVSVDGHTCGMACHVGDTVSVTAVGTPASARAYCNPVVRPSCSGPVFCTNLMCCAAFEVQGYCWASSGIAVCRG